MSVQCQECLLVRRVFVASGFDPLRFGDWAPQERKDLGLRMLCEGLWTSLDYAGIIASAVIEYLECLDAHSCHDLENA